MKSNFVIAALFLATAGCASHAPPTFPTVATAAATVQWQAADDERLTSYLDRFFEEQLAFSPEEQTGLGRKTNYGQLDRYSDEAAAERLALLERQLQNLRKHFPSPSLSAAGRVNYRLFEYQVIQARLEQKWRSHRFAVNPLFSPMTQIPSFLIGQHPIETTVDAEAYISRLRDIERVMTEIAARVRGQAAQGVILPQFAFDPIRSDALRVISGAPFSSGEDSPLLAHFKEKVEELPASPLTKAKLIADAGTALSGPVRRGYQILLATLEETRPKARTNNGAWSLPNGAEFYKGQLFLQTTTDIDPEEVHRLGLAEVQQIQSEMRTTLGQIGFTGTLQEFFAELKANPKYKYPNTEQGREAYLADAKGFIAQAMAAAPSYFSRIPKAQLEVRRVEKWRESGAPFAFYDSPAPDGSRPGVFYVNLRDMTQILKPQLEALSYHEGAPGHHFQIALAQELSGLPKFRQSGGYGAFAEGWALYAELLGKEMGFYDDPYSNFGRLSTDLWKAVRLVTDSGLHAKGWSREEAVEYFRQNSLLSDETIAKEVDRYIVFPAQATSYKIGELKILELRAKARRDLGSKFDLREFHDVVIGSGSLPLDVLEDQVDAYIALRRSS